MTLVGDIMRDDQIGLGVDRGLDILADHAAVPGAGRHGAGIGVCQRYLPIRRIGQGPTRGVQVLDMLPDAPVTLGQVRDLFSPHLALRLSIDPHHLRDVTLDVRLRVGHAAGDLVLGKAAIPAADG